MSFVHISLPLPALEGVSRTDCVVFIFSNWHISLLKIFSVFLRDVMKCYSECQSHRCDISACLHPAGQHFINACILLLTDLRLTLSFYSRIDYIRFSNCSVMHLKVLYFFCELLVTGSILNASGGRQTEVQVAVVQLQQVCVRQIFPKYV